MAVEGKQLYFLLDKRSKGVRGAAWSHLFQWSRGSEEGIILWSEKRLRDRKPKANLKNSA
jgi:hypothetical protein